MYRLYLMMKEHSPDQITKEEVAVASGQKVINPGALDQMGSSNEDIQRAFEKQVQVKAVCGCV